jgi:glycosyltransferase involved in cell wall biosynthesis
VFVSGFTIARNVVQGDYPLREAVESVLPLVDEMIIAVGKSDDDTLAYVRSFPSPKIRVIETEWDDSLRKGGVVLAAETNKALDACNPAADWCVYIQADECLHEADYPALRNAMEAHAENPVVEGLLFRYLHFYGSYDYVADSRRWYRHEVRIIRRNPDIRSYMDAQGFRRNGKEKLRVCDSGGTVYHYGWVKHPEAQTQKLVQSSRFWHADEYVQEIADAGSFDYSSIDSLRHFEGRHPRVMQERIARINWTFSADPTRKHFGFKQRLLYAIEKLSGWRPGEFRNFKRIRP